MNTHIFLQGRAAGPNLLWPALALVLGVAIGFLIYMLIRKNQDLKTQNTAGDIIGAGQGEAQKVQLKPRTP